LFRQDWFNERAQQAGLLAQALTGIPDYEASEVLRQQFMADTNVMLMSAKRDGMTELVLGAPPEVAQDIIEIDLRERRWFPSLSAPFRDIFSDGQDTFRVTANSPVNGQESLELLISRKALREAIIRYLKNIFWLSLLIAIITGTLIYLSMSAMIIRPVKRLADDMTTFRDNPDRRGALRKRPKRKDEIGQLEREFIDLKQSQRAAFRQRERLASLGLAVAKINHDLRNVLSSALLISDRLSMNPEPKLSDMGERLTRTVERGIGLTEEVMAYSKAETADPAIQDTRIAFTIGEAHNLFRNAAQAMAVHCEKNCRLQVSTEIEDGLAELRISDTGPGLPERAKENLFQAFSSAQAHSANTKSTGLGLSISKELAKAQGGDLNLMSSDETGTRFLLTLPVSE